MTTSLSPRGVERPLDLKRTHRDLYTAPDRPVLVDVPDLAWLALDGTGDPDGPEYGTAVRTLYTVSYAVRALLKAATGAPGHVVMPLEALWWTPDPAAFRTTPRSAWCWTALILQPAQVGEEQVRAAVEQAGRARKAGGPPAEALARVGLRRLGEGRAAQVMHHGPYAEEAATIDALHAFVAAEGLALRGHHHEIYLTDPRRCAPDRMRTVLRQPVAAG